MPALVDYSKWEKFASEECDEKELTDEAAPDDAAFQDFVKHRAYVQELSQDVPDQEPDQEQQLKIDAAMEQYESRRPRDRVMHHFWIKDAGDPDAIGEYFPDNSQDMRNGLPVYVNSKGISLSREYLELCEDGKSTGEEVLGWIIGHLGEMRGMYSARGEDQSPPTLGWQPVLAPEPVPTIQYYTHAMAAEEMKERGNRAFQRREWEKAEELYSQALECKMDVTEYAELVAAVLSNRAEVRLRTLDFAGAAADARQATRHLKAVPNSREAKHTLRQKCGLRLAKALLSMSEVANAREVLRDLQMTYPQNAQVASLLQEASVMAKADGRLATNKGLGGGRMQLRQASSAGHDKILSFVRATVDSLRAHIDKLDNLAAAAYDDPLGKTLKKLEYTLVKAQDAEGPCYSDIQVVLRTSGCFTSLLKLLKAQWVHNLEGKFSDVSKLPGLMDVASVVALACEASAESTRLAADFAHVFMALLGGCNRKVDVTLCEKLINLVAAMWKDCRHKVVELVQVHSVCVERAASFLSQVVLVERSGDIGGPDAPTLPERTRRHALELLFELVAASGRIEKRALRGVVPHMADAEGDGFFTSATARVRALGELVAQRAIVDPSTVTAREVKNLMVTVQLLIAAGPVCDAREEDMVCLSFDHSKTGAGDGATMRYVDLAAWSETCLGKQAALALQLVAKVMEYRLVLKDRALEREDFEDSFIQGHGLFIAIPLIQGPPRFAEPALLCLASLAQAREANVDHLVALSALNPLLGLPSPSTRRMPSSVRQTLRCSASARRHAAKVLAKCIPTQVGSDLLAEAGEPCVKELVQLISAARADGKDNLEAFHDMLHVFYFIAEVSPGCLCRNMPTQLLNVLADMSDGDASDLPHIYAGGILQTLMKDPASEQLLQPILRQREEGYALDLGDQFRSSVKLEAATPALEQID